MAVGEYISVSSQRDSEAADVATERAEQARGPAARRRELARPQMEASDCYKKYRPVLDHRTVLACNPWDRPRCYYCPAFLLPRMRAAYASVKLGHPMQDMLADFAHGKCQPHAAAQCYLCS